MIIYRDDHWPPVPLEPRGPDPGGDKVPTPDVPTPDAPSPGGGGEDGFPGGGGAGGAFDHPDYPEQRDPDFDDDRYYDGGADDRRPRDDEFGMRPLGNRCMQARHELAEAYDQLASDERAIDRGRERLAEDTAALGECGSSTRRFFVAEPGGVREETCTEHYERRIAASERSIEMHRARQRTTRAQIPVLRRRVHEYCVGP